MRYLHFLIDLAAFRKKLFGSSCNSISSGDASAMFVVEDYPACLLRRPRRWFETGRPCF